LQLIDLFANLWRYLAYDATAMDILRVGFYYLPKCVSYSLPVSLLFAIAYVLGDLYARNELIIVFTSGIPLRRLSAGFLVMGVLLSFASFRFEDTLVISGLRLKKTLSRQMLRQQRTGNEADVVVKADGGRTVYSVEFYNDADTSLNGVAIVERDAQGKFLSLLNARRARWNGTSWIMENPTVYRWIEGTLRTVPFADVGAFTESPGTFRRSAVDVEELKAKDARDFVVDLKAAGLPYTGALADYYRRFAFSVTPFVVIVLSVAMGGRFRKNVLLMSLLASLMASVIYYVAQMISMMLAKLGYISPELGAWAPAGIFIFIGAVMVVKART
ncbi:MAG: permease, partial [Treponema sp. GWA1_62_8]